MPDPSRFKNKKHWMQKCLHQVLHREKKDKDQGLAQCLNMWRQRETAVRVAANFLSRISSVDEAIKELRDLNLDPSKMILIGSAALHEHVPEFRTPQDLDLVFHPSLLPAIKELESQGVISKKGTTGRKAQVWISPSGLLDMGPDSELTSFDELRKTAVPSKIGPYLLASVERCLEAKRKTGRPKDFEDIKTIETLLAGNGKTASEEKTVYHGTNVLFNRFSLKNTAQGILWFSEDRVKIEKGESGAQSAKYIVTTKIRVDKTAGWPEYDKLLLAQLKSMGYDSIHLDDDWVLFDPKRAKVVKVEERQSDGSYKMTKTSASNDDQARELVEMGIVPSLAQARKYVAAPGGYERLMKGKMHRVVPKGWPPARWVPVCDSCFRGEHLSFGSNHMPPKGADPADFDRYGCKNVEGKLQCACNPAFTELMEQLETVVRVSKTASKIRKDVQRAKKSDKLVVFLGGQCDDSNAWRTEVKKEFGDKIFFIDPYDKEWEPEDNIYDELAGMLTADHTVFYRGGKGTAHERLFLDMVSEDQYADFDDLGKLKAYLGRLSEPVTTKVVNAFLKLTVPVTTRVVNAYLKLAMPWLQKGKTNLFLEMLSRKDALQVIRDLVEGKDIHLPEFQNLPEQTLNRSDLTKDDIISLLGKPNEKGFVWTKGNPNPKFRYENGHYVEIPGRIKTAGYDRDLIN